MLEDGNSAVVLCLLLPLLPRLESLWIMSHAYSHANHTLVSFIGRIAYASYSKAQNYISPVALNRLNRVECGFRLKMEPVNNRVLQTQLSQNFARLPSMRFLRIDAPLTLSLGGTSVPWPQRSKVKELTVNDGVTLLKDLAAFLEGFEGLEKFEHCCNFPADPFFNDLAATFVKALRDHTRHSLKGL